MDLQITLPNQIEEQLENEWGVELPRKAAEALAAEGYRSGVLSDGEVGKMLNLSVSETDDFLKTRGLFAFENIEELTAQTAAFDRLIP